MACVELKVAIGIGIENKEEYSVHSETVVRITPSYGLMFTPESIGVNFTLKFGVPPVASNSYQLMV